MPTELVWYEGTSDGSVMNSLPSRTGQPMAAPIQPAASVSTGVDFIHTMPSAVYRSISKAGELSAGLEEWMSFVGEQAVDRRSSVMFYRPRLDHHHCGSH